jgi:hypothetical protein
MESLLVINAKTKDIAGFPVRRALLAIKRPDDRAVYLVGPDGANAAGTGATAGCVSASPRLRQPGSKKKSSTDGRGIDRHRATDQRQWPRNAAV